MGRVSKYKKIKAIDPYSKQSKHPSQRSKILLLGSCLQEDTVRQKKIEKRFQKQLLQKKNKSKKNKQGKDNKNVSTFFDLPPDEKEDEFDLSTLTVRTNENKISNKDKTNNSNNNITNTNANKSTKVSNNNNQQQQQLQQTFLGEEANQQLQQELKMSRLLKIHPMNKSSFDINNNNEKNNPAKVHGRLEGESMKAFTRRINQETAMILKSSMSQQQGGIISRLKQINPTKYEKKISYLNKKKKQKKKQQMTNQRQDTLEDDRVQQQQHGAERLITGEYAIQRSTTARSYPTTTTSQSGSLLHDPVERPPTFSVLPRGAKPSSSTISGSTNTKKGTKNTNCSQELEQYRARVQAQYAIMKAKQREN